MQYWHFGSVMFNLLALHLHVVEMMLQSFASLCQDHSTVLNSVTKLVDLGV